jgi:hypothetical protein
MKRTGLFLLCLSLVIGFCSTACLRSTKGVALGTATSTRPKVPWDKVVVYRSAADVPGKYEEVVLLESTGDTLWTTKAGMWKSMRRKAGGFGANAIILDAETEPKAGTKVLAAALFGMGAERKGRAIGIYVYPPEPPEKK